MVLGLSLGSRALSLLPRPGLLGSLVREGDVTEEGKQELMAK